MQAELTTGELERGQLLVLNRRVTAITAFLVGPVVVVNLAFQAWKQPVWQFWALCASMVLTNLCWGAAYLQGRRGRLRLAAATMMYSALLFDASAMFLRQGTLGAAALADIGMIVFGWVFAPRLAYGGAIFAIVSLGGLRVLEYFGISPSVAPIDSLALMLDLSVIGSAIPVAVYFLTQRARISELPYQRLAESAGAQEALLRTVARLQPQVDSLVGQGETAARMLAAQARQQALTAEEVERAMQAFGVMLSEAQSAAQETREVAEATREQASTGRSQLAGASEQLERFQQVAIEIQASMEQLAQQSQSTEEVISFIRGIDDKLNVLAINAALEAARSGEAGRGFAVVANELRSMLRESTESLARGRELFSGIGEEAARTLGRTASASSQLFTNVESLREARSTIEDITGSFVVTADRVAAIAAAADRQQLEVQRVAKAMSELRQSASGLTDSARALSESMQKLAHEQQEVRELLSRSGVDQAA